MSPPSEIGSILSGARMRRAAIRTDAPSRAKTRAHDRPIPELAPVTKTILPFKDDMRHLVRTALRRPALWSEFERLL